MATLVTTNTLNSLERTQLRNAESLIQRHLATFVEVGSALAEIRDKQLYRENYKTFEKYVADKWDFKRDYAYKLIAASGVVENVSNCIQKPASEAQARPLAELPPDQQPVAWKAAVAKAAEEGKPVSAAIVQQVVEEMKPAEDSGTPDVAASVLCGMNTEAIKPTREQLVQLAALPEKQQDAIMAAVTDGATLTAAIKKASPINGKSNVREKPATPADEAKAQIKIWADTVGRWLGKSPSIDELRAKWSGPKGDAVVTAATTLFESLKNWQKAIK